MTQQKRATSMHAEFFVFTFWQLIPDGKSTWLLIHSSGISSINFFSPMRTIFLFKFKNLFFCLCIMLTCYSMYSYYAVSIKALRLPTNSLLKAFEKDREYSMIYRGQCFSNDRMIYDLSPRPPPVSSPLLSVSGATHRKTGKERQLSAGRGGEGGAWSSINHSILTGRRANIGAPIFEMIKSVHVSVCRVCVCRAQSPYL